MTDAQYRQALALFRYGLIAEFIQLPAGSRGLYARRVRSKLMWSKLTVLSPH